MKSNVFNSRIGPLSNDRGFKERGRARTGRAFSSATRPAIAVVGIGFMASTASAANSIQLFTGTSSLDLASNFTPTGVPTVTSDVVIGGYTGLKTVFIGNYSTGITVGSLNFNSPSGAVTVDNYSSTINPNDRIVLGGSGNGGDTYGNGSSASDLLYATTGTSVTIRNYSVGGTLGLVLNQSGGTFDIAGSMNISSAISENVNSYGFTKTGAGTLTLAGSNTFTGGVTLSTGTLNLNNAAALGGPAGAFTIGGGILDNTSGAAITTGNNPINLAGDFAFTGTNNLNLGSGAVALTATRTITTTAGTLTLGGTVSGAGFGITKAGAGTLSLTGTSTFSGPVTVNAGTLFLGGTNSNASAVTVTTGGTVETGTPDVLVSYSTAAGISVQSGGTLAVSVGGTTGFSSAQIDALPASATFAASSLVGIDTTNATSGFTYGTSITDSTFATSGTGLTKLGTNTLVLTGSNSYAGPTTVVAGTLQIGAGGTTGTLGTGAVALTGTLVFNRSNDVSAPASISGTGSVVQAGAGTLTLAASNSFTGGLNISSGVVAFSDTAALSQAAGTLTINDGATLRYTNTVGSFTLNSTKPLTLNTGLDTIETVGAARTLTINGAISGAGTLVKTGPGTLSLAGPNVFTGGVNLAAGTLSVPSGAYLGNAPATTATNVNFVGNSTLSVTSTLGFSSTRGFNIGSGVTGTINALASFSLAGPITGPGRLVVTGPNTVSATSTATTFTGGLNVSGGATFSTFQFSNLGATPTALFPDFLTLDNGTVTLTDNSGVNTFSANKGITLGSGGGTINLTGSSEVIAWSAPIAGTGSFTKAGVGTVRTLATDTYSGPTIVSGGVLRVIGTHNNAGSYTMDPSALLGGTGVINLSPGSTVTVSGTLSPGLALTGSTAVGTLNISGGTTVLPAGGNFTVDVSSTGTTTDQLIMSGLNVTAGNTSGNQFTLTLNNASTGVALSGHTLILAVDTENSASNPFSGANAADTLSRLNLLPGTITNAGTYSLSTQLDADKSSYDLILTDITAAPEPTSLLLAGLAAMPLALGRRWRSRSAVVA